MSFPDPDTLEHVRIREYSPDLRVPVLALCRSNVGGNFDESHFKIVREYVDKDEKGFFLVAEHLDRVVACGALEFDGGRNLHALCYGMVHEDFQGFGFGTLMLYARLSLIDDLHDPALVWLETSPEAATFYEQFGFGLADRVEDGYAPERDSMQYTLSLGEAGRMEIREAVSGVTFELGTGS